MTRLLLMEGNTADKRARAAELGVRSSSEIYALAILAHFPGFDLDVVNAADADWAIPGGRSFADYDGFVVTGSSLHAYDKEFAVTNQIAMLRDAAEAGLPVFGSCWGLQIAVMAAGGQVEYNPRGREVGFARKIVRTVAGADHPMFAGKGAVFDAPCIHYDEVTRLPDSATLLASNAHSLVQAAIVPVGRSEVWAVQYHPEFDIAQLVQLYTLYADDMIAQGFFADRPALDAYVKVLTGLAAAPQDVGLAWQLGVDEDITDDSRRRAEIINWIKAFIPGA
ncbi:type 1 glutamine amidotransferase [Novosphingobium sp. EMRT-2]|uniref:type 1 glutamine amidotransferase n=1 Tax=Novosphingobium sp. EMRT-2 TaxID=2571749 RepID=UPI0010BD86E9|nr:type 1 glutamine amidotransferase [Novosphingobium sp. EMRT-2]QCI95815.1 type 1 glutamine amidotransferase [Novosphingobium sp. EMRT-2]